MVKLWGRYTVVEVGMGQFIVEDDRVYPVKLNYDGTIKGYRIQAGGYFDLAEPWKRGLDVEFEVKGKLEKHEDDASIRIYNLDRTKAWNTAVGNPVRLRSGYVGYNDVIFYGFVKRVETEYRDNDVITILRCLGRGTAWMNIKKRWDESKYGTGNWKQLHNWNRSWWRSSLVTNIPNGHTWGERIRKVLEDYSIPIGYIHPTIWWLEEGHEGAAGTPDNDGWAVRLGQYNDDGLPVRYVHDKNLIEYALGAEQAGYYPVTLEWSLKKIIDKIKADSNYQRTIYSRYFPDVTPPPEDWTWSYYIRGGKFFFIPIGHGVWQGFVFSKETGLLDISASRRKLEGVDLPDDSTTWEVTVMLFPRVQVNSIIKVKHRKLPDGEQWMQIADYEHFSSSADHYTRMVCITRGDIEGIIERNDAPINIDGQGHIIVAQRAGLA